MGRCAHCRKKSHLGMFCKWCDYEYCTSCMQVEIHNCEAYEVMKTTQKQVLQNKLLREKTNGEKIVRI